MCVKPNCCTEAVGSWSGMKKKWRRRTAERFIWAVGPQAPLAQSLPWKQAEQEVGVELLEAADLSHLEGACGWSVSRADASLETTSYVGRHTRASGNRCWHSPKCDLG